MKWVVIVETFSPYHDGEIVGEHVYSSLNEAKQARRTLRAQLGDYRYRVFIESLESVQRTRESLKRLKEMA